MDIVDSWTFEEAVAASWKRYIGGGITSSGYRNNFLKAWANVVGRTRALRGVEAVVLKYRGDAAAAQALGLSVSSLQMLARFFRTVREVQDVTHDGLTLYFSSRIAPVDRWMVEATIFGVLGFQTKCEIVQFDQRTDSTIVRLQAPDIRELIAVAEALHDRVWEIQQRSQQILLQGLDQVFQLNIIGAALGQMANKLEKMELRASPADLPPEVSAQIRTSLQDVLGPDVLEMLKEQGAQHRIAKDSALLATWGQRTTKRLGGIIVQKVLGELAVKAQEQIESAIVDEKSE